MSELARYRKAWREAIMRVTYRAYYARSAHTMVINKNRIFDFRFVTDLLGRFRKILPFRCKKINLAFVRCEPFRCRQNVRTLRTLRLQTGRS